MPGIVGLITKKPREAAEPELLRMTEALRHEHFYVTGTWIDESLGVYVGWSAQKGSFYNHFRSKEHLAVDALNLYQASVHPERLQDSSTPPLVRLRDQFEFMISLLEAKDFRHG